MLTNNPHKHVRLNCNYDKPISDILMKFKSENIIAEASTSCVHEYMQLPVCLHCRNITSSN